MLRSFCENNKLKSSKFVCRKALECAVRYCHITDREVVINIEYPYYSDAYNKGPEGEIYCEHIIECYKCRYSGISKLYPDPFTNPCS